MTEDLAGEVVFVTGAGTGFGAAIARRYMKAGARVVATGRRLAPLQTLAGKHSEAIMPLQLDVRDRDAVFEAFASLPEAFKRVTILVNNAGLGVDRGKAQDSALEDIETMIATNISGLLYCTHAALPGMLERDRGHIVNIGSIAGRANGPGSTVYGATKAFVLHYSKNLKSDLIETAIRCSYIAPGAAETEFWSVRWRGDAEKARAADPGYKPLQPEDVAEAVFFATSMPAHVDVTELELMPRQQGFGARIIARDG